MAHTPKRRKRVQRKGTPFMFYLPPEQAGELDNLARKRSIPKAALVRFAISKLLQDMNNGQLELPLGIE